MGEDYADDLNCVWIIEGYRPMIEFTYFNIEDGGVVRVDDGESVLHEIRGRRGAESHAAGSRRDAAWPLPCPGR